MCAKNKPAMIRNEAVLNGVPSELYTIEVFDEIPEYCK